MYVRWKNSAGSDVSARADRPSSVTVQTPAFFCIQPAFTGPIVGAIAFNYLKVYAVASSQYWQLVLGLVLVVMVLVLPTGIVGTIGRLAGKLRRR